RGGHRSVAWDRAADAAARARDNGAELAGSLAQLPKALKPPRAVWVMVPAGEATESTIQALAGVLERGDTVIDGGNTKWTDDVRRGRELASRGLQYGGAGPSGRRRGLHDGSCPMVGGDKCAVDRLAPIFTTL